ncbi:MAG: hypothetical protein ACOYD5_01355 [Negativicutes bacterium]
MKQTQEKLKNLSVLLESLKALSLGFRAVSTAHAWLQRHIRCWEIGLWQ